PAPRNVAVNASGSAALPFTAITGGQAWLSVAPGGGTTNTTSVSVTVNPAGLNAGTYNGSVKITAAGTSNSPLTIPVTLTITAAPALSVAPSLVQFVYQIGGAVPAAQSLSVGGTAGIGYSVFPSTATGGSWLSAGPAGSTPGSIKVQANPAGLTAGTYTGTVAVSASGASNGPQNIIVRLTVSAEPLLSATPASLTFTVAQGSIAPPQQLSLGSSGSALTFSAGTS